MKAASYSRVGGPISVTDVPDPICAPDGVVLAVRATGICRSDWHAWHGRETVALPHVGGHEYAGEIVQIGSAVAGFEIGERVTVPFVCGCGRCAYCASGNAQVCPDQRQPGFDLPGSFAELVAVPAADANLVRLPDSVPYSAAAALGCRFATAFRAVTAHGRVAPGQWLAVHGCGGVGLSAVMIAVALGARVVAVDVSAAALERARALGAELAVDGSPWAEQARSAEDRRPPGSASPRGAPSGDLPGGASPGDTVQALTGGTSPGDTVQALTGGCHVSIDALGSAATAVASVRSLRRGGRHVQVGLLHGAEVHPPLPMDRVIGWELEIIGSHGMSAVDYPAMLAMVADGRLRPAGLVTRVIGLDGIGAALAAMDVPGAGSGITVAEP